MFKFAWREWKTTNLSSSCFPQPFAQLNRARPRSASPRKTIAPFADHATASAIVSGLSFVAVGEDGSIVGAALAEDWAHRSKVPAGSIAPSVAPLIALLDSLHQGFQPDELAPNVVAYGSITVVSPALQGARLGPRINGAAIENMQVRGFRYSYAEFTNPRNARFAQALPADRLRQVSVIPYDTFEFEGARPFSKLEGGASSYLFAFGNTFDLEKCT